MLVSLSDLYKEDWPDDFSLRSFTLFILDKVVNNKIYEKLQYGFYTESTEVGPNPYIPLNERRPSAPNNICKKVVDDSVSLLFSEGHFPKIHAEDASTRDALRLIAKNYRLNEVMMEAALYGSIGSVAIQTGIINGQLFYLPLKTIYLTPEFDNEKTRNLISVTEKKQVCGHDLVDAGYPIKDDDLDEVFWFMRVWNTKEEIHYKPWKDKYVQNGKFKLVRDDERSTQHNLGFVPIVWIKNLPGGDLIDGQSSFSGSVDIMIDRDYLTSQVGRSLRYSADPTLVIKAAGSLAGDDDIIKSADRALVIDEDGDAKLLEISGNAAAASDKHVRALRESAIETIHGNRANTDKLSVAQSGKAMEMMNQDLVWLADKLRTTYGEGGLVTLLRMTLKMLSSENIKINGKFLTKVDVNSDITLVWPPWYSLTPDDLQKKAIGITTLVNGKLLSRETAIRELAAEFDIEDVTEEIAKIDAELSKLQLLSDKNETPGGSNNQVNGG